MGAGENLEFLIPINSKNQFIPNIGNIKSVPCKSDILSTMSALLNECEENEWVLWAIDDRYPFAIEKEVFNNLVNTLEQNMYPDISGIKLLPWREQVEDHEIEISGVKFKKQKPFGMFGFWHHQFVKAKLLKDAFFRFNINSFYEVRPFNKYYQSQKTLPF